MKKVIIAFIIALMAFTTYSQDQESPDESTVTHSQQLKIGTSIQYQHGSYYYYDYDYFAYYSPIHHTLLENYDGQNSHFFVAYEHIWTFQNSIALAVEPKLGLSVRDYTSNPFLGVNWKFYWANRDIWRMGLYIYTGYEYNQGERSVSVSMENGMYTQMMDLTMHQSVYSFDVGLVPFQFMLRSIPLLIECNVNILGIHVYKARSSEYEPVEGEPFRYKHNDVGVYGPRVELKLGWQLQ